MNRRYYTQNPERWETKLKAKGELQCRFQSAARNQKYAHHQFSSSKYSERYPQIHSSTKRNNNFLYASEISRGITATQNTTASSKAKSFISKKVKFSTLKRIDMNTLFNQTMVLPSRTYISDFAYQTYQGKRDYNEDKIQVNSSFKFGQHKQQASLFSVFDGHGGSSAAEFLQMNISSLLQAKLETQVPESALANTLIELESKVLEGKSKIISGTCALVCLIILDRYYIANVGDSRALIIRTDDCQQITRDHKPNCPVERTRIQENGGRIYRNSMFDSETGKNHYGPYRVMPGKLSVSRTIGDMNIKKSQVASIISCEPQIFKGKLNHQQIILLLSDGAYEQFSNQEISSFFSFSNTLSPKNNLHKQIQKFIQQCKKRETCDNVSVVGIQTVKPNQGKSLDNITCPSL